MRLLARLISGGSKSVDYSTGGFWRCTRWDYYDLGKVSSHQLLMTSRSLAQKEYANGGVMLVWRDGVTFHSPYCIISSGADVKRSDLHFISTQFSVFTAAALAQHEKPTILTNPHWESTAFPITRRRQLAWLRSREKHVPACSEFSKKFTVLRTFRASLCMGTKVFTQNELNFCIPAAAPAGPRSNASG